MWALVISLVLGIVYSVDYPGLRAETVPCPCCFVRFVCPRHHRPARILRTRSRSGFDRLQFSDQFVVRDMFHDGVRVVIALFKDLPTLRAT